MSKHKQTYDDDDYTFDDYGYDDEVASRKQKDKQKSIDRKNRRNKVSYCLQICLRVSAASQNCGIRLTEDSDIRLSVAQAADRDTASWKKSPMTGHRFP